MRTDQSRPHRGQEQAADGDVLPRSSEARPDRARSRSRDRRSVGGSSGHRTATTVRGFLAAVRLVTRNCNSFIDADCLGGDAISGFQAENADLSLTVNRSDLERVMAGEVELEALLADGTIRAQCDLTILGKLAAVMVEFDPRFEIMPGTKGGTVVSHAEAFEGDIG